MRNTLAKMTQIAINTSPINDLSSTFLKRAPRKTTSTKLPLVVTSHKLASFARQGRITALMTVHGSKMTTNTKSWRVSSCTTVASAMPVFRARSTEAYQNVPGLNLKNRKEKARKKPISPFARYFGSRRKTTHTMDKNPTGMQVAAAPTRSIRLWSELDQHTT